MRSVTPLTRLLVVLAVALQSFGVLRDIHASHSHPAPAAPAAAVHPATEASLRACADVPGHSHSPVGSLPGDAPAWPGDEPDCPTCDLLAVMAKGWTVGSAPAVAPGPQPVGFVGAQPREAAPERRWTPARSRDPPMNDRHTV